MGWIRILRMIILCVALAALIAATSTLAAPADDRQTCFAGLQSDDARVAACGRAIASGRFKGNDLARLYEDRAHLHSKKRDYDRSIADHSMAIQLGPKDAISRLYWHRGSVYFIKGDYDRAIADFSEAIRSNPKYTNAYFMRAGVYREKGDFDRAIADYSEVIELEPDLKQFNYGARGDMYAAKGDYERAIADYTEAIRLNPNSAGGSYLHRGIAHLYTGSLANALADIKQANELPSFSVFWAAYKALWLDVVHKRNDLPSRLPQAVAQLDMTKWPAPLVRLLLGQLTPDAVLAAADDPDAEEKKRRVCLANFYIGEWALRQGAKDEAARRFRLAVKDCSKVYAEWWAGNRELVALGVSP